MNKFEFKKGIEKLELAYNQNFNSEKLILWWNKLKDMNCSDFYERLDTLIETKKFMPNIAEILDKKERLSNFEKRDYSDFDFDKIYANYNMIKGG